MYVSSTRDVRKLTEPLQEDSHFLELWNISVYLKKWKLNISKIVSDRLKLKIIYLQGVNETSFFFLSCIQHIRRKPQYFSGKNQKDCFGDSPLFVFARVKCLQHSMEYCLPLCQIWSK